MSTPLAIPSDLETFLGMATGTIDTTRATQILSLSQSLCESVVTPLPATALVVVLTVAGRSFANPEGVTAETVGPYTVQRPAGLYLSKADKATLRRLVGGTGAFSIDTMPTGVNAVQVVTVTAIGGTFTLALSGQSTGALAFNASSTDVAAALGALSLIGPGNVTVAGSGTYTVTFVNHLGTTPLPTMTADGSLLTGTAPLVTVVTSVAGIFAPGQGLAPWDRDYFQSDGSGGGSDLVGGGYGGGPY